MKRFIAVMTALLLVLAAIPAGAEEAAPAFRTDKLIVATTTPFNGNFLSDALGNNISDRDVRTMIHGYSLVKWNNDIGAFMFDDRVVSGALSMDNGRTYTLVLSPDLVYSDGTPVTAWDYAFSFLLLTSAQLRDAAGLRADGTRVKGFAEYDSSSAKSVSGFRVINDHQFSITLDAEFEPYFYELQALNLKPYPISVIAPGCKVKDDGAGIYIDGDFTAELLKENLLDPDAGYMSYPEVTTGPYKLVAYDGSRVQLEANPNYRGDQPSITQIDFRYVDPAEVMSRLRDGKVDLVVRCARLNHIQVGMGLSAGGDITMRSYSRNGLALLSFCGEKGPASDPEVRKILAAVLNRDKLAEDYLGNYGIVVNGYYGLGQWMYLMANGTIIPGSEEEEEAWADLNLEGIEAVWDELATDEEAGDLFEAAGWVLNEADGIRYKEIDGQQVPLKLKMYYPEGNESAAILGRLYGSALEGSGAELTVEAMPMQDLLQLYYGLTERDCDIILMGTNFSEVFDPAAEFDENGKNRLTGITDPELAEIAQDMRKTEPGDAAGFCRKWLRYQERWLAQMNGIPLYSNAYFDFFIVQLRDYNPAQYSSWAEAVQYAVLSEEEPQEEPAEEEELEEGEEVFDD